VGWRKSKAVFKIIGSAVALVGKCREEVVKSYYFEYYPCLCLLPKDFTMIINDDTLVMGN
jgi:hypothetical protein